MERTFYGCLRLTNPAHRYTHMPLLQAGWKTGSASCHYWLSSILHKGNCKGSILIIIFFKAAWSTVSSFQYHLCVLVCGAWKQLALLIWDVIAIIPLRKENIPVLVVLHKAPLKAGTPRVNTHTTRGMSCKHHPSVHHSWLWCPCST